MLDHDLQIVQMQYHHLLLLIDVFVHDDGKFFTYKLVGSSDNELLLRNAMLKYIVSPVPNT